MSVALRAREPNLTTNLGLSELIHGASVLLQLGDASAACQLYHDWIDANPGHALLHVVYFNLSTHLGEMGEHLQSMQALERAIACNADFLPAYVNLGRIYENLKAPERALELWYAGVSRPMQVTGLAVQHTTTALKQIARLQMELERGDQAEPVLARCIAIDPSQDDALEQYLALRMRELRWPVLAPIETLSSQAMLRRFHPLSVAAFTDDPLLQLSAAYNYSRRVLAADPADLAKHDRRDAKIDVSGRRIRVGYLSSDLRDHAIGYLLAEFFELQDRNEIECFTYFIGRGASSPLSTRIETAVEHWRDTRNMSDDAIAERIAADEIDILVDVNGHTRDAHLGVLARRPAPIQVNWLGFPGSMGTPFHHYMIADPWIVPPEAEKYYSERVVRLPCYQPNDRKRAVADKPTRADAGLPDDAFVFCSFNAPHKITRFTLLRWIEILKATPNSVLWLLDCSIQAKQTLASMFASNGVSPPRLVFAPKLQNAHHLARYPLADLFLDTLPYGAHTTASDALWMSVPVLTLSGRCFAARVCGSLVQSAGLGELVVADARDYVRLAIELGTAPQRVAALREKLAAQRDSCVLFDQPMLAEKLGEIYASMVADYNSGNLPMPDLTNLDRYLEAGIAFDHEGVEMAALADYEGFYRSQLERADRAEKLSTDSRLWNGARA